MKRKLNSLVKLKLYHITYDDKRIYIHGTYFYGIALNSIKSIEIEKNVINIRTDAVWITIFKKTEYIHVTVC